MIWACWVQIIIRVKAAYRGEKLSAMARIFGWRGCSGAAVFVRATSCRDIRENWRPCESRGFCQCTLKRNQMALTIKG
jgi:hypothetical protein